jgi:hypothetical protein
VGFDNLNISKFSDIWFSCKLSPEFEFKFKRKFLLIFLAAITFSKPALFSGDFSYKNGITEVMMLFSLPANGA